MLKKLLVFALWSILLCLLLVICLIITTWQNWPAPIAFLLLLIIAIVIIALRLFGLYLFQSYHNGAITRLFGRFRLSRMEYVLFQHWKAGAAVIRRIHRRKKPLPWYMITGKRCGKSTLLAGAGLPMFSHEPENILVVPTRTLRWWFYRSLAVLDISSHFLDKSPIFGRGWLKLTRWCKRLPPPSGIIICVSVRDLLQQDSVALHLDARRIRTQIEPLINEVKQRLPLYVMITCCDEIPGFSQWAQALSPQQRQQALGHYWPIPPVIDGSDPALLDPMFTLLNEGLGLARMSMLARNAPTAALLPLLDFPEQIAALQPALQGYLAALCEPDAYFEQGTLGAVWFTASEPISKNSIKRQSLFLHDLITQHLPAMSRNRQIEAVGVWRRYYQHWGRTCFYATCVLLLGISGWKSATLVGVPSAEITPAQWVSALQRNEQHYEKKWVYLPFIPLLNVRHKQLNAQLLEHIPRQPIDIDAILSGFREHFYQSDPIEQRQLIRHLAQSIRQKQAMLEGQPLVALFAYPPGLALLNMNGAKSPLPYEQEIALQRALIQQPSGASQIAAQQALLVQLINSTQWHWLLAPDARLTAVTMEDFGVNSGKSKARIEGIWTLAGNSVINADIAMVTQVIDKEKIKSSLASFYSYWISQRQSVWLALVLAGGKEDFSDLTSDSWQKLLLATDQGNSPAMRLAQRVHDELTNIDTQHAQPWLQELRRLIELGELANAATLIQQVSQLNQNLQDKLDALLGVDKQVRSQTATDTQIANWLTWRDSLSAAVADAMAAPESSNILTRGLFTQEDKGGNNPLLQIDSNFALLQKSMNSPGDDFAINAVWALYQTDGRLLVRHALAYSSCWLQDRWQSQVLWPMDKNRQQSYNQQQVLTSQYLADFVKNDAQSLLLIDGKGARAGEFQGQSVALTPAFLRLVNHELRPDDVLVMPERKTTLVQDQLDQLDAQQKIVDQQREALGSQPLNIHLSSQPATIPGGARLMPIGSSVTLTCNGNSKTLDSMNFSDSDEFSWQPAQCRQVTLVIKFPGFDIRYNYSGEGAWPNFLDDFSQGEHIFQPNDFPTDLSTLADLGIKSIMVRYKIGDQSAIQHNWQQWNALIHQQNELDQQRRQLQTKQSEQQLPTPLKGKISQLPAKVAACY
ncbi:type VI secretion protein IcmF [Yersinia mollaretii]|uniref:Type VI secretion protein IcmF n=2 Tax=Yersinia mollaretii TaxID=33060 RepID=A0AA36PPD7_YERMO|nr:type VI secretion protein IcmF [Yersinia mollaretii]